MSIINKLQEASFKNVSFLIESETTKTGKKTVIHEYPNSDKRYVETMGILPPTFSVRIVISDGIVLNETLDPLRKRKEIEKVLLSSDAGDFVHPVYGRINNVVATDYSIDYSQRNIGRFVIVAEFATTSIEVEQPKVDTTTSSAITYAKDNAIAGVISKSVDNIKIPNSPKEKLAFADKISSIFNKLNESRSKIVNPIQDKVAEFGSIINSSIANIYSIMSTKEQIKTMLTSVFRAYGNITNLPSEMKAGYKDLISFGSVNAAGLGGPAPSSSTSYNYRPAISFYETRTVEKKNIAQNDLALDEVTRLSSISFLYEAEIYSDGQTEDEILSARTDLEAYFQYMVNESITFLPDGIVSAMEDRTTRDLFYELRIQSISMFDKKVANSWKVKSIDAGETSIFLSCYDQYESIDNIELLRQLNYSINNINTKENVKIIVEQ